MSNIIKIETRTIAGTETQTVDARELHTRLEIGKDFSTWIKDRIEQYGFSDGEDFAVFTTPQIRGVGNRGKRIDYILTIDMAKELAMVENNTKGREIRRYFIECERRLRQPETKPSEQALHDVLRNITYGMLAAKALEIPKLEAQQAALAHIRAVIGADFSWLFAKPVQQTGIISTTELARRLAISTDEMHERLEIAGLQQKHRFGWVATTKGVDVCATTLKDEYFPFSPNLKWHAPQIFDFV